MESVSMMDLPVIQTKLLESSGKTLMTLHNNHSLRNNYKTSTILKEFDRKKISSKMKKMFITNIFSLGDEPNANLRGLALIILKLVNFNQENQQILTSIKTYLYGGNFDLKKIQGIPNQGNYKGLNHLSNVEMKKILAEFFNLVRSTYCPNRVSAFVQKYYLAIELMVILFRAMLFYLKFPEADNYEKKASTTACFQILFDFLDIFYNKSGNIYLLREDNLFIQNGYENQLKQFIPEIIIGDYYDNQQAYKAYLQKLQSTGLYSKEQLTYNLSSKQLSFQKSYSLNQQLPSTATDLESYKKQQNKQKDVKRSNLFAYRDFNLASNRSQTSFHCSDAQNDHPTPSFNEIFEEDKISLSFKREDYHNTRSKSPTHSYINMKQSATILPVRNKTVLYSSTFHEMIKSTEEKGSLQLTEQVMRQIGVKNKQDGEGLDTNDTPKNILFGSIQDRNRKHKEGEFTHNMNNFNEMALKIMKRSQSEKNSFVKNSQVGENEQKDQNKSLFSIKCKRLKTSIQFDESYQRNFNHNKVKKDDFGLVGEEMCQHSSSSCSCTMIKIKKNKLVSKIISFTYIPQKKTLEKLPSPRINQGQGKKKVQSRLTDQFFKNLKAKKEVNKEQQTSKSKSENCLQEQNKINKKIQKNQIQFSQFLKMGMNSIKSKTPDLKTNQKKQKFQFSFKKNQQKPIQNEKISSKIKIKSTNQQNSINQQYKFPQFIPKSIVNRQKNQIIPEIETVKKKLNVYSYKPMINMIQKNQLSSPNNQSTTYNFKYLKNNQLLRPVISHQTNPLQKKQFFNKNNNFQHLFSPKSSLGQDKNKKTIPPIQNQQQKILNK